MADRLETLLSNLSEISFNLSLLSSSAAKIAQSQSIALVSVKIIGANPSRKGLILYNNSANSIYVALGSAASSSQNMTFIIANFQHFIFPAPIYTGDVYGVRNAGTGAVITTELT